MGNKKQNSETIKELVNLYRIDDRLRHPNCPDYARTVPQYSDRTSNGLTKCIIDYVRLTGGQAERTSTTGRFIDKRIQFTDVVGRTREIGNAKWILSSGTCGSADISATIKGKSIKIEVKIGRDSQSEAQKAYQAQVERAGGIYIIARSFSDFLDQYKSL